MEYMRTIAHISDLHFGTVVPEIADGLTNTLERISPDLVVVSGDLTQRARHWQYRAARAYLDKIPFPKIIVPGNHDIPLYNFLARFFWPLRNYRRYITTDFYPFYQDEEMAVQGINTARSLTWKNGRISLEQMETAYEKLIRIPNSVFKVLVTHHPFLPPPGMARMKLVGRAAKALRLLKDCNLDILLAGHFHMSYTGGSYSIYTTPHRAILVIQAGTATSSRTRNHEKNAFNLIQINKHEIRIMVYTWNGTAFKETKPEEYMLLETGWVPRIYNDSKLASLDISGG